MSRPYPSKWEKPHEYGEGKHAGRLEDDNDDPAADHTDDDYTDDD